jgi:hypothetical protein
VLARPRRREAANAAVGDQGQRPPGTSRRARSAAT